MQLKELSSIGVYLWFHNPIYDKKVLTPAPFHYYKIRKSKREKIMDLIATYSETRFSGKRDFELYPDYIRVHGKVFLHSDFDVTIPLVTLKPNCSLLRIREASFIAGMWLILISLILTGILVAGFKLPIDHVLVLFVASLPIAGFILCLATFHKVEFIRFQNDFGIVLLDVARAGKDKNKFDAFIQALTATIRKNREIAEPTTPPYSEPTTRSPQR